MNEDDREPSGHTNMLVWFFWAIPVAVIVMVLMTFAILKSLWLWGLRRITPSS